MVTVARTTEWSSGSDSALARSLPRGQLPPRGRLILVTCADAGRLDLVLGGAARRLAALAPVELAQPVVTRPLPAGSGMPVSKRSFAALAGTGAMCLSWCGAGRTAGYTISLLDRLAGGAVVVAGAGIEAEGPARAVWRDVRVVRLEPGTETLRSGLSAAVRAARRTAATATEARLGRVLGEGCDARVRDVGDVASAVRALAAAIEMQLPPAARQRRAVTAADHASAPAPLEAAAPRSAMAAELLRERQVAMPYGDGRAPEPKAHATMPT